MARRREPGRPRLRQRDYEALAAFRYAMRSFLAFSARAARAHRLTPQQHQAMLAVRGFPGPEGATIGDLAERLAIRHHSAVGLMDRLAARGLAKRAVGAGDRRRVFVALTPAGMKLLDRLSGAHREELARVGGEMKRLLRELDAGGAAAPRKTNRVDTAEARRPLDRESSVRDSVRASSWKLVRRRRPR